VHERVTNIHIFTRLTTAQTWGKPPPSPFIIFFVIFHMGYIQMSFCPRIPKLGFSKFPKLGLLQIWRFIIFCADLRLKWGLKQSCILYWELSNNMWHSIYTQINQGDSQLLVVGSQIDSLTFGLSFGHNLCLKYSNEMCKLILNILVLRPF